MSASNEAVNIRILDREYTVGVPPEERESLLAAARVLLVRFGQRCLNLGQAGFEQGVFVGESVGIHGPK